MNNDVELFSVYHNTQYDDLHESYFIGAFTSEAFAVEGFQQWIKDFLEKEPMTIELIESINKCSSIEGINKAYAEFANESEEDVDFMYVVRHRPNEIMGKIIF